jgi:LmbE family N-acetylglucosaminyl deacetylase
MMQEAQIVPYAVEELPFGKGPWLVLAPHADDESMGMGGSLAKAARKGIETYLWVLTDGALGGTESDLVGQREREAREAAKLLGMQGVQFYRQPDRQLRPHTALAQRLLDEIRGLKPSAVFFPGAFELHPDHRGCALLAWQVLQRIGVDAPAAVSYEISTQSPVNCLVDITDVMEYKQRALQAYQSQLNQNNYVEVSTALNKLRTFTLPAKVEWAEGFYRYSPVELAGTLASWASGKMAAMLAE